MSTPVIHTVEAQSKPGVIDPDDSEACTVALTRYPEYLERYGVDAPAVAVDETGTIHLVATVVAVDAVEARRKVERGWSFMPLHTIIAYKGDPV